MTRLRLAVLIVIVAAGCARSGGGPTRPSTDATRPSEQLPVVNAAGFTEADCERYDGHPVTFAGTVTAKGGVQDLYYVYLNGGGANGRRWHALVSRADWMGLVGGEHVVLSGTLRLHDDGGVRFAVLHKAALVETPE